MNASVPTLSAQPLTWTETKKTYEDEVICMKENCNSSCRGHGTTDRAQGKRRVQELTVKPPPKGPEPLYRVVYTIDINAKAPNQAARYAHRIMQDPQSIPPVLDVLDHSGECTRVDLSDG